MEPQYAAYNVKTKDEKTFTGIVVKRNEKQLILRDAENKEVVIAGRERGERAAVAVVADARRSDERF